MSGKKIYIEKGNYTIIQLINILRDSISKLIMEDLPKQNIVVNKNKRSSVIKENKNITVEF